jgi:hypothetical protein
MTGVLFMALGFLKGNLSHQLDILQSIMDWRGFYSSLDGGRDGLGSSI